MNWEDTFVIESLPLEAVKSSGGTMKADCPACDDTRGRLYFLWDKNKSATNVYCHNCGYARNLKNFVKEFYPDSYQEKDFVKIGNRSKLPSATNLYDEVIKRKNKTKINLVKQREHPKDCILLDHLRDDHKAVKYVKSRMIPKKHYSGLYYCQSFKTLANKYKYDTSKWIDEDRLVIPYWNQDKKLVHIQGRSFLEKTKQRYITLDCGRNGLKIWGLDRLDRSKPIYITEGPIDAMFLPNSLALGGSKISSDALLSILDCDDPRDVIFVFDNEPENEDIRKEMEKKIVAGFSIVLWDRTKVKEKDVNAAVLEGFDVKELSNMICHGSSARIMMRRWI